MPSHDRKIVTYGDLDSSTAVNTAPSMTEGLSTNNKASPSKMPPSHPSRGQSPIRQHQTHNNGGKPLPRSPRGRSPSPRKVGPPNHNSYHHYSNGRRERSRSVDRYEHQRDGYGSYGHPPGGDRWQPRSRTPSPRREGDYYRPDYPAPSPRRGTPPQHQNGPPRTPRRGERLDMTTDPNFQAKSPSSQARPKPASSNGAAGARTSSNTISKPRSGAAAASQRDNIYSIRSGMNVSNPPAAASFIPRHAQRRAPSATLEPIKEDKEQRAKPLTSEAIAGLKSALKPRATARRGENKVEKDRLAEERKIPKARSTTSVSAKPIVKTARSGGGVTTPETKKAVNQATYLKDLREAKDRAAKRAEAEVMALKDEEKVEQEPVPKRVEDQKPTGKQEKAEATTATVTKPRESPGTKANPDDLPPWVARPTKRTASGPADDEPAAKKTKTNGRAPATQKPKLPVGKAPAKGVGGTRRKPATKKVFKSAEFYKSDDEDDEMVFEKPVEPQQQESPSMDAQPSDLASLDGADFNTSTETAPPAAALTIDVEGGTKASTPEEIGHEEEISLPEDDVQVADGLTTEVNAEEENDAMASLFGDYSVGFEVPATSNEPIDTPDLTQEQLATDSADAQAQAQPDTAETINVEKIDASHETENAVLDVPPSIPKVQATDGPITTKPNADEDNDDDMESLFSDGSEEVKVPYESTKPTGTAENAAETDTVEDDKEINAGQESEKTDIDVQPSTPKAQVAEGPTTEANVEEDGNEDMESLFGDGSDEVEVQDESTEPDIVEENQESNAESAAAPVPIVKANGGSKKRAASEDIEGEPLAKKVKANERPTTRGKSPYVGGKGPCLGGKRPYLGGKRPYFGGKGPYLGGLEQEEDGQSDPSNTPKSLNGDILSLSNDMADESDVEEAYTAFCDESPEDKVLLEQKKENLQQDFDYQIKAQRDSVVTSIQNGDNMNAVNSTRIYRTPKTIYKAFCSMIAIHQEEVIISMWKDSNEFFEATTKTIAYNPKFTDIRFLEDEEIFLDELWKAMEATQVDQNKRNLLESSTAKFWDMIGRGHGDVMDYEDERLPAFLE